MATAAVLPPSSSTAVSLLELREDEISAFLVNDWLDIRSIGTASLGMFLSHTPPLLSPLESKVKQSHGGRRK